MKNWNFRAASVCLALQVFITAPILAEWTPADLDESIQSINAIHREGAGNEAAGAAWQQIARAPVDAIPHILAGMNRAGPLSMNALRVAAETVAARAEGNGQPLPQFALARFILDTSNHPRARALAFEMIQRQDPAAADLMLRSLLNDPSNSLRRQAVAQLIAAGEAALQTGRRETSGVMFRQALEHARDVDQIQFLSRHLEEFGHPVDLPTLFGFITDWKVIGPFDNSNREGFERVYPPEREIDLDAAYPGKKGNVSWTALSTDDPYGMLDINKAYPGMIKDVTAYAHAEFVSGFDSERPVELRLGCKNAWKVWLNGEFLFGRDEYHRGRKIDQYIMKTRLRPGPNQILVKICQNEQVEDWTVEWEFQLRVCDDTGRAVLALNRP